jgi:hypothetical protein
VAAARYALPSVANAMRSLFALSPARINVPMRPSYDQAVHGRCTSDITSRSPQMRSPSQVLATRTNQLSASTRAFKALVRRICSGGKLPRPRRKSAPLWKGAPLPEGHFERPLSQEIDAAELQGRSWPEALTRGVPYRSAGQMRSGFHVQQPAQPLHARADHPIDMRLSFSLSTPKRLAASKELLIDFQVM